MRKSALQPRSRKTPRGGRMMARIILQMSLQSKQCYLPDSHHSLRRIELKGKKDGCGGRRDDLGRCRGQEKLETYLAVKAIMNESRS